MNRREKNGKFSHPVFIRARCNSGVEYRELSMGFLFFVSVSAPTALPFFFVSGHFVLPCIFH